VVVAFPDLMESGDFSGFNVLIHEFAHKLDMGNSLDVDGFPPLPREIDPREWHRVFMAVWDDLQAHLERGEETPIDDYAATHPGECFAVCCEAFFTAPDLLHDAYPALHDLLARYFRQDSRWPGCPNATSRRSRPPTTTATDPPVTVSTRRRP
jgi:MtfA peptidase